MNQRFVSQTGFAAIYLLLHLTALTVAVTRPEEATQSMGLQESSIDPERSISGVYLAGVIVAETGALVALTRWTWLMQHLSRLRDWWMNLPVHLQVAPLAPLMYYVGLEYGWLYVAGVVTASILIGVKEWWTTNILSFIVGVTVTAAVGAWLNPSVVVILLLFMLAWDIVAVYLKGIMQEMVTKIPAGLPMYFTLPTTAEAMTGCINFDTEEDSLGYSILGLGDVVLPGFLVVSAASAGVYGGALGALVGAQVGFGVLSYVVLRVPRAHAGLPPIVVGTVAGYYAGLAL